MFLEWLTSNCAVAQSRREHETLKALLDERSALLKQEAQWQREELVAARDTLAAQLAQAAQQQMEDQAAVSALRAAPYVAMHVRSSLADQRDGRQRLDDAVRCARARLAAANASTLFVATMYQVGCQRPCTREDVGGHAPGRM